MSEVHRPRPTIGAIIDSLPLPQYPAAPLPAAPAPTDKIVPNLAQAIRHLASIKKVIDASDGSLYLSLLLDDDIEMLGNFLASQQVAALPAEQLPTELPPLPKPEIHEDDVWRIEYFTARQMQDYARAARIIAQDEVVHILNGHIKENAKLTAALAARQTPTDPDFIADLARSRSKHPGIKRMFDGLLGEVHELARAYDGDGDVRAEAFDVAVCAYRIATEGDSGSNTKLQSVPADFAWGVAARQVEAPARPVVDGAVRDAAHGTFACPICGHDEPHGHSDTTIAAYRQDQVRNDGWLSALIRQPKESGWYLCDGVTLAPREDDAQHSWFVWVRDFMKRSSKAIPEVLYWNGSDQSWYLRNALGNARHDGSEGRRPVVAIPCYWREVPTVNNAAIAQEKAS